MIFYLWQTRKENASICTIKCLRLYSNIRTDPIIVIKSAFTGVSLVFISSMWLRSSVWPKSLVWPKSSMWPKISVWPKSWRGPNPSWPTCDPRVERNTRAHRAPKAQCDPRAQCDPKELSKTKEHSVTHVMRLFWKIRISLHPPINIGFLIFSF